MVIRAQNDNKTPGEMAADVILHGNEEDRLFIIAELVTQLPDLIEAIILQAECNNKIEAMLGMIHTRQKRAARRMDSMEKRLEKLEKV